VRRARGLRFGQRAAPALFTVGAKRVCTVLIGPLSLEAGLYVGGGGGGGARSAATDAAPARRLLWDFGGYRAGVSISNVRFPSGQIDSTRSVWCSA